jgi:hypothetical protein
MAAVAVTRWCALIAFRVTSLSGDRPTKLLNKTNPANNKVFLITDGVPNQALDGDLDAQIPTDSSVVAIAAFPLPAGEPSELSIEFLFKAGAVRIPLPSLAPTTFAEARTAPTLVDIVKAKLTEATAETRAEIAATRTELEKRASSSSALVWVVVIVLVLFLIGAIV